MTSFQKDVNGFPVQERYSSSFIDKADVEQRGITMRFLPVIALLAGGLLANVQPAAAQDSTTYPFCATNSGLDSHECLYQNFAQCQAAIDSSGWCDLNKSLQGKPGESFGS